LGKIVTAALSPIALLWSLAERHIWPAIGLVTAGALGAWLLRAPMVTLILVMIVSLLLMRVEPLADAAKAARATAAR
jgi:hypothetical protein